jgi:hypothetical protein
VPPSTATHVLYRDVPGLTKLDPVNKTVQVRLIRLNLAWCRGWVPVGDEAVMIFWQKDNGVIRYRVEAPAGYKVTVDNQTGLSVDSSDWR